MRQMIQHNSIDYRINKETPPLPTQYLQSILRAQIVDELTGSPVDARLNPIIAPIGVESSSVGGGIVGLLGTPFNSLSALSTQAYNLELEIVASGYIKKFLSVQIPQDVQFPNRFVSRDLGVVALQREPVRLAGQITRRVAGSRVPEVGASVQISGIWRSTPASDAIVPPSPSHIVAIHPPLSADFGLVTVLSRLDETGLIGTPKTLEATFSFGASSITISNWNGLVVGSRIRIGDESEKEEVIAIESISPIGDDSLPATIELEYPLHYTHPKGTSVQGLDLNPIGGPLGLDEIAFEGDHNLLMDPLTLTDGDWISLSDGIAPTAYHRVHLFSAVTDGNGRYRFPFMSRVAQFDLTVTSGPDTLGPITHSSDFSAHFQKVDLEL